MSTDTATTPVPEPAEAAPAADEGKHHHGPHDLLFVKIALLLAAVTAVEVAWTYIPWPESGGIWTVLEVGGLLLMMCFKFYVVASVFMHLKWDHKLLTSVFYFGLILALAVYMAVLVAFEFFSKSTPPYVN